MVIKSILLFPYNSQIIAVNGVSLLTRPYTQSLRILQESGRTVELIISQIYRKHSCHGRPDVSTLANVTARLPDVDYLKIIRYQTDDTQQRPEIKTFAKQNGGRQLESKCRPRSIYGASSLCAAKSMPDLPKVKSHTIKLVKKLEK